VDTPASAATSLLVGMPIPSRSDTSQSMRRLSIRFENRISGAAQSDAKSSRSSAQEPWLTGSYRSRVIRTNRQQLNAGFSHPVGVQAKSR